MKIGLIGLIAVVFLIVSISQLLIEIERLNVIGDKIIADTSFRRYPKLVEHKLAFHRKTHIHLHYGKI